MSKPLLSQIGSMVTLTIRSGKEVSLRRVRVVAICRQQGGYVLTYDRGVAIQGSKLAGQGGEVWVGRDKGYECIVEEPKKGGKP